MATAISAWLARIIWRYATMIVAAAFALTAAAAAVAWPIDVRASVEDLLPPTHPISQAFHRAATSLGATEDLIVVAIAPEGVELQAFAERLEERLLSLETIAQVFYRTEATGLADHALYFLPPTEAPALAEVVAAGRVRLQSDPAATTQVVRSLMIELDARVPRSTVAPALGAGGLMLSPDRRALAMAVRPQEAATDPGELKHYYEAVSDALLATLHDFPAIEAGLTGFPAIKYEEDVAKFAAVGYTTLWALLGIMLLFILAFRRLLLPLLALLPLLLALVWTTAFATLIVDHLSLVTAIFGVLLLGLGIDFAIHFVVRYNEERILYEPEMALQRTLQLSGAAILLGATTTSLAFFALMFGQMKALFELGLIAGAGILLATLATLVVLPALVVISERRRLALGSPMPAARPVVLAALGRWLWCWAQPTAAAAVALLLVALWAARSVEFAYDINKLIPRDVKALVWEERLVHHFGNSFDYSVLLFDNLADLEQAATTLRDQPSVQRVDSVLAYLPEATPQVARLQAELAALVQDLTPLAGADPDLLAQLQYLDRLASSPAPTLELLPVALRERFVGQDGSYVLYVVPTGSLWDQTFIQQHLQDLSAVVQPAVSMPIIYATLVDLVQADTARSLIVAALAVLAVLWLHFRRLSAAAAVMLPLAIGIVFLLGAAGAFGLSLTIYNAAALPLLAGIGVDSGIHLYHRWLHERDLPATLAGAGRAVLLAGMTSLIGFGSLSISIHQGIAGFGQLMLLGLVMLLLAALVVFPALLACGTTRSKLGRST